MNLINRQDAIAQGLTRYFTGKPCKHGHVVERLVKNKTCITCSHISSETSKAKNLPKYRKLQRDWVKNNPDLSRSYTQKYVAKNKGKRNLWTSNYRNAKVSRMPEWLNDGHIAEIEGYYEYCSALRTIGLDFHVDHIVPLRGTSVSGLHVPWNLQVIPGSENMSKGNRFNG